MSEQTKSVKRCKEMIEDYRYVLIPEHEDCKRNKPLYFHNVKEIVNFLHCGSVMDVTRALQDGSKLKNRYFVDINVDYFYGKELKNEGQNEQKKGVKVITDIYGLV